MALKMACMFLYDVGYDEFRSSFQNNFFLGGRSKIPCNGLRADGSHLLNMSSYTTGVLSRPRLLLCLCFVCLGFFVVIVVVFCCYCCCFCFVRRFEPSFDGE